MNNTRNKGVTLVYAAIAMVVLMGFLSLAVDFGRVQLSKTQLQHAVDAAAGYAVKGLSDSTAVSKAQAIAAENKVDSTALALLNSDVEVGVWDSSAGTFTATSVNANAVRVTGHRSSARGTAIPLFFGQVIGRRTQDISASSIAMLGSGSQYNTAVTGTITMSGSAQLQKDPNQSTSLTVASNGGYNMSGTAKIVGNAYYSSNAPSRDDVTGNISKMSTPVSFPNTTTPRGATSLGALNWTSNRTLSGGTYSISSFNFSNGTATLSGNVSLYVSGNITISSNAKFDTKNGTYALKIYQTGSNTTFNYSSNNSMYAAIYSPNSNVTISGSGTLVGSLVAKNLTMSGSSTVSYNSVLPIQIAGSGGTPSNVTYVSQLPSAGTGDSDDDDDDNHGNSGNNNGCGDRNSNETSHCRSHEDDDDQCGRSHGYSRGHHNSHDDDDDDDHNGNCHGGSGHGWGDDDDDDHHNNGHGGGC